MMLFIKFITSLLLSRPYLYPLGFLFVNAALAEFIIEINNLSLQTWAIIFSLSDNSSVYKCKYRQTYKLSMSRPDELLAQFILGMLGDKVQVQKQIMARIIVNSVSIFILFADVAELELLDKAEEKCKMCIHVLEKG